MVPSALTDPTWNNTAVIIGDLDEQVATIKQAYDGRITVHGCTQLVPALLDQDRADEVRLMVFPVILGAGQRLFGETSNKKPQRLVDSRTVGDGVTILTHAPVRQAMPAADDAGLESKREAAFRRAGTRENS